MASDAPVTAIMITGKVPDRYPLAQASLNAFRFQENAPNAKLLILSEFDKSLLPHPISNVKEVRLTAEPGRTLGDLRNMAMDMCDTRYAVQWDDDDFSHKNRLTYQLNLTNQSKDEVSLFRYEIHCNLLNPKQAFINDGQEARVRGFAGTMMFPVDKGIRFPSKGRHEDTEFLMQFKHLKVISNPPQMYLRFYHGHNTWSQQHVMKRKRGAKDITPELRQYVNEIVKQNYAAFNPPA